MNQHCVALLGRRDEPTDAVEEYCRYLGAALQAIGISFDLVRVRWTELGWRRALQEVRRQAMDWKNDWVFVQYTALAWSRRGFPLRVVSLLRTVKKSGIRCAIVFHDAEPYSGDRIVDRIRRILQLNTMRETARLANLAVLTVPLEKIAWLPADCHDAVFIPVGANLPCPEKAWSQEKSGRKEPPTVAVFSLSGGQVGWEEVDCIAEALRYAADRMGALQVTVLGRNSERTEKQLRESLLGASVKVTVQGLLSPQEVVRSLGSSDVLLFARGPISTRRGSAIAGIACGLPVVAREGSETAGPITEAGVVLLPAGAKKEFGPALLRVLTDVQYRASLAQRSRRAQEQHFSWQAIALKYATALQNHRGGR